MMRFRRRKRIRTEIEPYEIFLDSKNLPDFNVQQMEGRLEKPIQKTTLQFLGIFFCLIGIIFFWQLGKLQIVKGEEYFKQAENNSLDKKPIFADRGIIYDRNGMELAWNTAATDTESFSIRTYIKGGFAHLLGYVGYPAKDKSGKYWQDFIIGKDGLEKQLDGDLQGKNGTYIFETDALGNVKSTNVINRPETGKSVKLSIDARVQKKLYESIENLAQNSNYRGGGGVIMDINTGEVIAMTSYPEYDPDAMAMGDNEKINGYFKSKGKPFMNRVTYGLYTPGSIIKPILAIGALNEGIIDPNKQIYSAGELVIPNRYSGDDSVFRDNKAHGWVNMYRAIAVSSNIYFYEIGGGYKDQQGLGISRIKSYSEMFGLGKKTGIPFFSELSGTVPSPEWKAKNFKDGVWRLGDTYHTAIGQYGFQATPIQIVRAIGAIANGGKLVKPHFLLDDEESMDEFEKINIPNEHFEIVKDAMRRVVTEGTGMALNIPGISVAAKSGTAQIEGNTRTNSWIVGFFPYENPKYAFTVLMESGEKNGSTTASHAMANTLWWMRDNTPEYFK